jgi:hypothetical protein
MNRARRGFALNSAETSILNSHVSGFAGRRGDETQAVAGWNGSGPFHIVNNYLEGAGDVVLIAAAILQFRILFQLTSSFAETTCAN